MPDRSLGQVGRQATASATVTHKSVVSIATCTRSALGLLFLMPHALTSMVNAVEVSPGIKPLWVTSEMQTPLKTFCRKGA